MATVKALLLALTGLIVSMSGFPSTLFDSPGLELAKIRYKYQASDGTPDHLVFQSLARLISDILDGSDPSHLIGTKLGAKSATRIDEIAKLFDQAHAEIVFATANELTDRHCRAGHALPTGEDAARSLDELDDMRFSIYQRVYQRYLAMFTDDERLNLGRWLDEKKRSYTYIALNHREFYADDSTRAQLALERFCLDASH